MKDCFGWWADGMTARICEGCITLKECKEDWVKSGGRVGGFFDKYVEKK